MVQTGAPAYFAVPYEKSLGLWPSVYAILIDQSAPFTPFSWGIHFDM